MAELATARYANAAGIRESGLLPCAVSIGMPRWPLAYDLVRESPVRSMCAPWGLLHADLEQAEFVERYIARLERHRAEEILAAIEQLAREHDERGAVLLCWEDIRKPDVWCHRRVLADWVEEQTGLHVPELELR